MKKKTLTVASLLVLTTLASCGSKTSLGYYDQIEKDFDTDLFYRNGVAVKGADPGSLYISDKNDPNYGYYYIYPTSDFEYGCLGYVAYRTKDFNTFENCGAVFTPETDSFSQTSFWAPEVIYDKDASREKYGLGEGSGVYYLFYTADDKYNTAVDGYYPQFLNREDKKAYDDVAKKAANLSKEDCVAIINSFRNTTPAKFVGYEEEIKNIISKYDLNMESAKTETEKTTLARDCYTRIYRTIIHVEHVLNDFNIGVAVSSSPSGPFKQYTNEVATEKARALDIKQPFLDAEDFYELGDVKNKILFDTEEGFATIDLNPYVDPVSHEKYLFFVRRHSKNGDSNFICGMKMGDSWTDDPQWDTIKRLTKIQYTTVNGYTRTDYERSGNTINEGPEMLYHDGKYYLTFSVDNCNTPNYAVGVAVSNTILGDYTKLQTNEGGLLLSSNGKNNTSGVGHHSFVEAEGETICIYHGHWIPEIGKSQRIIKADRCLFTKNASGLTVPFINGPTTNPQPKFLSAAEYVNIASAATIKDAQGNDLSYLADGLIPSEDYQSFVEQFDGKGETAITLSFDDYKTIKAIMVYNSYDLETLLEKVNSILIKGKKDGNDVEYELNDIMFDTSNIHEDFVNQCSAIIAEFEEISAKEITINIKTEKEFSIGEIAVLGKMN